MDSNLAAPAMETARGSRVGVVTSAGIGRLPFSPRVFHLHPQPGQLSLGLVGAVKIMGLSRSL
jgi:hypothetical protein